MVHDDIIWWHMVMERSTDHEEGSSISLPMNRWRCCWSASSSQSRIDLVTYLPCCKTSIGQITDAAPEAIDVIRVKVKDVTGKSKATTVLSYRKYPGIKSSIQQQPDRRFGEAIFCASLERALVGKEEESRNQYTDYEWIKSARTQATRGEIFHWCIHAFRFPVDAELKGRLLLPVASGQILEFTKRRPETPDIGGCRQE